MPVSLRLCSRTFRLHQTSKSRIFNISEMRNPYGELHLKYEAICVRCYRDGLLKGESISRVRVLQKPIPNFIILVLRAQMELGALLWICCRSWLEFLKKYIGWYISDYNLSQNDYSRLIPDNEFIGENFQNWKNMKIFLIFFNISSNYFYVIFQNWKKTGKFSWFFSDIFFEKNVIVP